MKSFKFERIVRECEKWFNEACKAWMWDGPRADLEQFVRNPSPLDIGKALTRIGKLAAWHSRSGCVSIGNSRTDEGWQEMRRFFDYELWSLRTQCERVRLTGGGSRNSADPTRKPFLLLAMQMAFRDWEAIEWLGGTVIRSRNNIMLGHGWGSEERETLSCYVCELYTRCTEKNGFPDDFGPYEGIFSSWGDASRLGDAIHAICGFHVEQIRADGEFEHNPHDIFPSEILALYRVREKLGLETPWVKHPLLETPFTQVPEKITYEPDPLVVQAMELVEKLLPDAVAKR